MPDLLQYLWKLLQSSHITPLKLFYTENTSLINTYAQLRLQPFSE